MVYYMYVAEGENTGTLLKLYMIMPLLVPYIYLNTSVHVCLCLCTLYDIIMHMINHLSLSLSLFLHRRSFHKAIDEEQILPLHMAPHTDLDKNFKPPYYRSISVNLPITSR